MVSQETRDALDELNKQVAAAEHALARLPGSRHANCGVWLDDAGRQRLVFGSFDGTDDESLYLARCTSDDELTETTLFCDLPISRRVELADASRN